MLTVFIVIAIEGKIFIKVTLTFVRFILEEFKNTPNQTHTQHNKIKQFKVRFFYYEEYSCLSRICDVKATYNKENKRKITAKSNLDGLIQLLNFSSK